MSTKIVFHDLEDFRRLYWEGWPEARLARYFSVSRPVVRRVIVEELGWPTRSYFDSNRFLAEERSFEERRAQTAAASAARWVRCCREPNSGS